MLVGLALRESPVLRQAEQRVAQARARCTETAAFFDPSLRAAGGVASAAQGIPGSSAAFLLPQDSVVMQAAVDLPLLPGAYLSAGVAERYYTRSSEAVDSFYQTLAGLQVRAPLWRDFGFRQWRKERRQVELEAAAAEAALLAARQDLRHRVELAYIATREAMAGRWVVGQALVRAQALLGEAEELSRLQAIPVYQVYPARMEFELRRQDVMEAERICDAARRELALLLGGKDEWDLSDGEEDLSLLAAAAMELPDLNEDDALAARGSYLELALRLMAAEALVEKLRDDLRPDVSLNAGITYQGENENDPWGDQNISSRDSVGGEVTLVFRRAWGLRAERARLASQQAVVQERRAMLQDEQLQIERGLNVAYTACLSARRELETLERAVASARETLESEQDRFRLGEGRSRNVLDAQKDLSNTLHRRNRAAALFLRAGMDYHYAGGYVGGGAVWTAEREK